VVVTPLGVKLGPPPRLLEYQFAMMVCSSDVAPEANQQHFKHHQQQQYY
jgi:hypothetical protein